MARICVVTAGHLATCPRMLKAADALAAAGHHVRVVSTRHADWAAVGDQDARRRRGQAWSWTVVDYTRREALAAQLRSGARLRAAQALVRGLGVSRAPLSLLARAYSRMHPELVRAALAEPADLVFGGTTGALAAVAEAARRAGVPYALDLEDFHSAEQDDSPAARLAHAVVERIERVILADAAFLTAASAPIALAYADKYGVHPLAVHNTFPLPPTAPDLSVGSGRSLRLYWFSQTVGPRRGLEDAVRAMGAAGIPGELHLRGRPIPDYHDGLRRLGAEVAPSLRIVHHEPSPPDAMVDACRGYDVGLSLEQGHVLSRALCLTNKAFTYILAGLAVALTDTAGQRPLAVDLGPAALRYRPGDVAALAGGLKRWAEDKPLLARAKAAAWQAAQRRWHWEHAEDRGALLDAVEKALR